MAPPRDSTSATSRMNCARLPSSGPGATAVRSACSSTCSTGEGRWEAIAVAAARTSAGASRPAPTRARPAPPSAPRPVTPSHSASRRAAATTPSTISARRSGRRHRMRADRPARAGAAPAGEVGELAQHVAAQLAGRRPQHVAAQRVDGAAAAGRGLPDQVRRPTGHQPGRRQHRPPVRRGPLLPLVVRRRRRPRPAPASRRRRPARRRRRSRPRRPHGPVRRPAPVASRRRSRTARPPARSTRGGRGPQSAASSSTRPSRSEACPPAASSTESAVCVVSSSGGGSRSRRRCSRPPRSRSATSRGTTTWSADERADQLVREQPGARRRGRSRPCRGHPPAGPRSGGRGWPAPPVAPAPPARRPPRRWRGWPGRTRAARRTTARARPGGDRAPRRRRAPRAARRTRARAGPPSTGCRRTAPWPGPAGPAAPRPAPRSTGSPQTAKASRTCRWPRSRPSRARWTLARVPARAAREVRSEGAGRARSGRRRTSALRWSSLRVRTSSARLRTGAARRDEGEATRPTVIGAGPVPCRPGARWQG